MIGFFLGRSRAAQALAQVKEKSPQARCRLSSVHSEDWSNRWRRRVRSRQVGRIWVGPPWQRRPQGISVVIEPKMAFGTGDHPTTALCLEALDHFLAANPKASVLDIGTGSGVLAIAAKKLGASKVMAIDCDPVCVAAARENCDFNRTPEVQVSGQTVGQVRGKFELVVANILANTLVELAPQIRPRVKSRLVLSGLLTHQRRQLEIAYRRQGLTPSGVHRQGPWLRLDFRP